MTDLHPCYAEELRPEPVSDKGRQEADHQSNHCEPWIEVHHLFAEVLSRVHRVTRAFLARVPIEEMRVGWQPSRMCEQLLRCRRVLLRIARSRPLHDETRQGETTR